MASEGIRSISCSSVELRDAMQRIALEWPSYGRPRITAQLRRQGWTVNPKRVCRIMREDNLLCLRHRRFLVTTTKQQAMVISSKI